METKLVKLKEVITDQGVFADRKVVLAREVTKKFEEYLRGTPGELLDVFSKRAVKGEFVVLIAASAQQGADKPGNEPGGS